jgi:L-rhamnose isomerase
MKDCGISFLVKGGAEDYLRTLLYVLTKHRYFSQTKIKKNYFNCVANISDESFRQFWVEHCCSSSY